MKLYHGSDNGYINELKPILSNHGKEYVYLCNSRALAIIYSHNSIPRPGGFFTYRFTTSGALHYDEYFENQLEVMYKGKSGYVYTIDDENLDLQQLEKMPWVYLSEHHIKVNKPEYIKDIYEELLSLESVGQIQINRYNDMTDERKDRWKNVVKQDIENKDLKNNRDTVYAKFITEHFPDLMR